MRRMLQRRGWMSAIVIALGIMALAVSPAFAQLDPLLFLKRVPPTVVLVVDTSMRMLEDGQGFYYDPNEYVTDSTVAAAMGVNTASATRYRRKYQNLAYNNKYQVTNIFGVGNDTVNYGAFYKVTRLEIAKEGIAKAVGENPSSTRWGLLKLRQSNPAWLFPPGDPCDGPVVVTGNPKLAALGDTTSPCNAGGGGAYGIYVPRVVGQANHLLESPQNPLVAAPGTASSIVTIVNKPINTANTDTAQLVPAGMGPSNDRPLVHALEDAKAEVQAAMKKDDNRICPCRSSVVVLIVGGQDDGDSTYTSTHNPATTASSFLSVTANSVTKRVPIFVAAVKPPAADESELQTIAVNSGGRYFNVSDAEGVARVINLAVQAGYARAPDFDAGSASEFQPVSPVIGSVNLKGAEAASGSTLPASETDIQTSDGAAIPQRSNVLVTSGFALNATPSGSSSPGFEGRLRAFRVFKPVADASQASGYKFVRDGTPLWPDVDGRPETAGLARVPLDPNTRNVFTYIPGTGLVAFATANAATIGPHLGGADANVLIPYVRALPIGAVIGSTPAVVDSPSIDPPPDEAYGRPDVAGTYAGDFKDRRTLVWVGTNGGMIHALDARTGFEVWAFIPYNLLPKLQTLRDGQPVERFDYFVDSSPKVADVKLNGTTWRTILIIGEAWGGTFYQAFDITDAGMGGPPPDSDDYQGVLSTFADGSRVDFLWSFPQYSSFDPNVSATISLTDGTPGGQIKFYGDLKSSASLVEKSVGFTWSDPAVGPLTASRSVNVAIVGSGYFPAVEAQLPGRGSGAPLAGRFLYLLDIGTGMPMGSVSSCGGSGSRGCVDVSTDGTVKNAIQADLTAAGAYVNSPVVTKAYVGDVAGRYWRFNFSSDGTITFSLMTDTDQPVYGSSALLFLVSSDQYMFFATGSDLLPGSAQGGTGTFKLYGLKDNYPGSGATTAFSRNLATVSVSGGLVSGERPSTSPSVGGDIVFFTTTTESGSAPCNDFSGKLYGLTFLGGAAYDTDASGSIGKNESPVIRTVAGRATAPFIVDQHLYFGSTGATGANIEIFGDPEDFNNGVGQVGVRILSWRELRD